MIAPQPRLAPNLPLPPYSYVPGHDLPHPVNDPRGHSYETWHAPPCIPELASDQPSRHHVLAKFLATNAAWLYAVDLFNGGYYWEAHEAWEHFWNALGRTTPEARCVQALIHLAAAAVKIREGKPAGVSRHTQRARELFGAIGPVGLGDSFDERPFGAVDSPEDIGALGLSRGSLAAVFTELASYRPECWHTSRTPIVRVVVHHVCVAEPGIVRRSTAPSFMPPDQPTPAENPVATQPDSSIENGFIVYTEAYHLKRGYCCGSGCRHCPYAPRHVEGNKQVRT